MTPIAFTHRRSTRWIWPLCSLTSPCIFKCFDPRPTKRRRPTGFKACAQRERRYSVARLPEPSIPGMLPQRAGLVRIAVVVGHVGRNLLFDQHPPTGEQLHHAGDDLVQHCLQRLVGWRRCLDEFRRAVCATPVHAIQHQAVQVNVEIGRGPRLFKARLDQRDDAAVGLVCLHTRLPEQEPGDHAVARAGPWPARQNSRPPMPRGESPVSR